MDRARLCVLLGCLWFSAARGEEVTFTEVSPYSRHEELVRRMLSRAEGQELMAGLAREGKRLADQPLDPARERFVLHVPPDKPEGGYGLLVFVLPWDKALIPPGWEKILDMFGVIYVAAADSGNEQRIVARRAPLALIAAANVMARYPVDPARVFIGGLSGGSRVAERLALAYPDLFRGALLNAGSDPIGEGGIDPLPPDDLLRRFQEGSRMVLITGELDTVNRQIDIEAIRSFEKYCQFSSVNLGVPGLPHAMLPAPGLKMALKALLRPQPPDRERLETCRAGLAAH